MQKLQFKIEINAPAAKVWDVLWNDKTYPEWAKAFMPGSHAKSDWQEGSRIHFLSPEGDGMYSLIDKKVDNEVMSFKHLGMVKDGNEQPLDDESRKWAGAMETYYLKEENGRTILECEIDMQDEHAEMFNKSFPEAFRIIKELSEK